MRIKINLAAVGILGAVGGSLVTGLLVRKYYDRQLSEEIHWETVMARKRDELKELLKVATYEIHEMRYALKCMVDEMQYDTIMAQIEYKFGEYAKRYPDMDVSTIREKVEKYVEQHDPERNFDVVAWTRARTTEMIDEELEKARKKNEDLVSEHGYGYDLSTMAGDSIVKAHRCRRAMREAAEREMAEREYPGEEVGSERLAPNGDILDETYDPQEDYDDELPSRDDFDEADEIARAEFEQRNESDIHPVPYIISEYQYIEDPDEFKHNQIAIEYFALDDILMDEDESIMDQSIVGVDNLREFERTDCPSIFVRNEKLGIDYEILYNDGSYHVEILDEPEGEIIAKRIWRSWEKEG